MSLRMGAPANLVGSRILHDGPALYSSMARSCPQPVFRISRFRPAFARTLRPGACVVPFAERVMPAVFKSSMQTNPATQPEKKSPLVMATRGEKTKTRSVLLGRPEDTVDCLRLYSTDHFISLVVEPT